MTRCALTGAPIDLAVRYRLPGRSIRAPVLLSNPRRGLSGR
ncbi:hypothetical protein L810_5919 [Burkholderia sp. AU4i]|nr:hypothetical protein L810_5919 [Burkholderia sp. AU4i]